MPKTKSPAMAVVHGGKNYLYIYLWSSYQTKPILTLCTPSQDDAQVGKSSIDAMSRTL
jgi:hypothetical protein